MSLNSKNKLFNNIIEEFVNNTDKGPKSLIRDLVKYIIHDFKLGSNRYYYIIEDIRYVAKLNTPNDTFMITQDLEGLINYVLDKACGKNSTPPKSILITIPDDITYELQTNFNADEFDIEYEDLVNYIKEKL